MSGLPRTFSLAGVGAALMPNGRRCQRNIDGSFVGQTISPAAASGEAAVKNHPGIDMSDQPPVCRARNDSILYRICAALSQIAHAYAM